MKKIILSIFTILVLQTMAQAGSIKFVQVTDTHFKNNDDFRAKVLKSAVKSINNEKGISFVVFTGDNIDSPRQEYLPEFVKTVNKLNVPYYIVIGNHDVYRNNGLSKARYMEIVKDNNYFYRYNKPNYVFKRNGFVFIVVDGAKEIVPDSLGYYRDDTLKWLDKQLDKYKNNPVIIFQHFPLVATKELKSHEVYKKEKYFEILDKHNNVISVVTGHLHINSEVMRNGVYHISSPTLLNDPYSYKVITIVTTKGFSPMIYTELKNVEIDE